ncbi:MULTISPECIES: PQQ-binding-like beta-propeller repeat protein [unclassified Streptomyces]|uniref:outer membrane protein assembly factor BamB family protein n=1 Tax=unclassified Streptomyces TaxID=2593676 RepID=UPI00332FE325
MTTDSSPGQEAPREEPGWAFRPRTPSARPSAPAAGTRWDSTMPLRMPQPRDGAHEAVPGADRQSRGATAGHEPGPGPAATAVLDPPAAARQQTPHAGTDARRVRKARPAARIALVLAVLVAACTTAAVLLRQEDTAAVASRTRTQAWQIPAPAADDTLTGSWLTGHLLVRASTRGGLRAYDLADGAQVWSLAPGAHAAGRGTVPCAMSPALGARGIGTVAFGEDGSTCTWLAGVKASTGRILWTMPLTDHKHPTAVTATTYLQDDVATVVSENFLGGVDVRTGSRVWGYQARGHYCNAYDWGTDGTVLVSDFCLDRKTRFTLTAYDGKTGKRIWRRAESAHSDVTHILSGSPLVAAVHTAHQDAVRVFDSTGSGRKLAVGDDELTGGNGTDADHSARLHGDVLVTPATHDGTVLDGFDTTTGAKLWTRRSAVLAVPAPGADDTVYAVTTSGSPQLVTVDPRTGRTTPVASLPAGTGPWSLTSGTVYVTGDGGVLELNALGADGGVRMYR